MFFSSSQFINSKTLLTLHIKYINMCINTHQRETTHTYTEEGGRRKEERERGEGDGMVVQPVLPRIQKQETHTEADMPCKYL